VKEEHRHACEKRWKQLRNLDVQEVAGMNIKDNAFYQWMHYNVDKEEQELYKKAWSSLRTKFNEACDGVGAEQVRA
jgi:hemerythrin-like domain-containing protein